MSTFYSVSLLILTILFLQAAIGFREVCPRSKYKLLSSFLIPCHFPSPPAFYPFLDYPMYSQPHYEGEQVDRYLLFGISENSATVPILPTDVGLTVNSFRKNVVRALLNNDREKLRAFVSLYQKKHKKTLIELRLENYPLTFSEEGIKPGAREITKAIVVKDLGGK